MPVKNRFAELLPEIIGWRHDFHAHPELLFDLPRTAGRVAQLLRGFGCDEVTEGIGRSGVVAVIRGRSTGSGRVVALRADMDALPIVEATGLDFASVTPGVMHACGHDGHTAMLLGAAKYLVETRNFDGTAVLVFQPAEEGGGGGLAMLRDGLIDRWCIDEVYAMHNQPGLPVGQFAIRPGAIMGAADTFEIRLTGRGGHAARPHDCVDPMVIAAQVILGLQSIVARGVDPLQSAVVSVTLLHSDSPAHNVIPQVVTLAGTARTLDPAVRDLVEARLTAIATGTASAHGAEAQVTYSRGYPVTVNAAEHTRFATEAAERVAPGVTCDTAPLLAAEDFSYLLEARPGAYILLGNGDTAGLHHPGYVFDDRALPFGASWFAEMIETRMPVG